MALQPGSTLGPYEILSLIGTGGMGEVYLAREISLGRNVALKVLPSEFTHDPHRVARFEQEARSASALSHPNICTIHALGELPDGRRFIAMEYVAGETLRHRIATSRLTILEAVDIASQVATALSAAHAAGIVHRDIKPENIMLRPDGFVKVLDFGLAKLTAASESAAAESTQTAFRTDAGTAVGTIAYMSPEQARGQQVDARTDIWALGAVLYEMVAGRGPFVAQSSSDVLAAILERDPYPLARFYPDVPSELQRIVSKTLRKDREQRYQSMKDLLLDLQALRDELQVQARAGSTMSRQPVVTGPMHTASGLSVGPHQPPRTRSHMVPITSVLGLVALISGGAWWWARTQMSPSAPAASSAPVQRNLTRLTFGTGLQTDATFSPDGRFIAFASDRSGNFDIWVQSVSGGDPVQVTKSPSHDTQPDWSPDGSTLVFRSDRENGGLYVVPALGGPERRITSFGVSPRWSPNGDMILFASALPFNVGLGAPKLYVVAPASGAEPHEFGAAFHSRIRLSGGFDWYPESTIVSTYAELQDGTLGVFNISADGRIISSFADKSGLEIGPASTMRWDRSAQHLFVDGYKAGLSNLWRLRADEKARALWEDLRLTTGAGQDSRIVLSRDGKRLAFATEHYDIRLWAYPVIRGGHSADMNAGRVLTDTDTQVVWTDMDASSERVVYTLVKGGSDASELLTLDLNTARTTTIARDAFYRTLPQWSHSGHAIAYRRERNIPGQNGPETDISIRREGMQEEVLGTLPPNVGFLPFDWSPSDEAIVASLQEKEGGAYFLVLVNSAQRQKVVTWTTLLRDDRYHLWQGTYSPNGQWLALVAQPRKDRPAHASDPVSGELAVNRVDRTEWKILLPGWDVDKPRWSRDGQLLYFVASRGQSPHNVWGVAFDDKSGMVRGDPFQVTKFDGVRQGFISDLVTAEFGVSARNLVIPVRERSGSIWMLDNVDK